MQELEGQLEQRQQALQQKEAALADLCRLLSTTQQDQSAGTQEALDTADKARCNCNPDLLLYSDLSFIMPWDKHIA